MSSNNQHSKKDSSSKTERPATQGKHASADHGAKEAKSAPPTASKSDTSKSAPRAMHNKSDGKKS